VGILLMGGAGIADLAGNSYGGGVSDMCDIFNWRGFLAHPQDARKYTGDPHSFSVAVDCGSPTLVYQWKWNDGVNPVFDVGANAPSFPIANVALAHAGEFWCAVSYDGETYESNAGLLEVADHLQITNQPVGIDVKNETAYTFAVITSGGFQPLRYQWKLNGVRLPATSRTYTIPSLRTTDSGDYTVEIADDYADVVVSEAATLNVTITVPATGSMGLIVLSMLTAIAAAAAILGKRAKRRQRSR
jgi:hypothetical protein